MAYPAWALHVEVSPAAFRGTCSRKSPRVESERGEHVHLLNSPRSRVRSYSLLPIHTGLC